MARLGELFDAPVLSAVADRVLTPYRSPELQASSHTTGDEHARDRSYLNPSYLNPSGQPLMRMTFDCQKNEHPLSTRASQV